MIINIKYISILLATIFLLLILGCGKTSSTDLAVNDITISISVFRDAVHSLDADQQELTEESLGILFFFSKPGFNGNVVLSNTDKLVVNLKGVTYELTGFLPSINLTSDEFDLDEGPLEFSVTFVRQNKAAAVFTASFPSVFKLTDGANALNEYFPNRDDLFFTWDSGEEANLSYFQVNTNIPCFSLFQQELFGLNSIEIDNGVHVVSDNLECIPGYVSTTKGTITFWSESNKTPLALPRDFPEVELQQIRKEIIYLGKIRL